jgi:hypothetical protein
VTFDPGSLLGSPPRFPDLVRDLAWTRYAVVLLILLWVVLQRRSRRFLAGLAALAFVSTAVGFWVLALGRPYGLFVDAEATRRAAEVSVATTGGLDRIVVAGPPSSRLWNAIGRSHLSPRFALLIPTLLPLLVVPLTALLVRVLWADRTRAALASILWLAFSTGDLEGARNAGVLTGCWSHPEAALTLGGIVGLVLLLGRLRAPGPIGTLLAAAPLVAWFGVPGPPSTLDSAATALLLTVDQGLWIALGVLGIVQRFDPASRALVAGGAVLTQAASLGAPVEAWGAHACYRLGLILAASGPLLAAASRVGEWLSGRFRVVAGPPARTGIAAVLLVALPGSFLVWWDPTRLDPVARDSVEPLSSAVEHAMEWIRRETPATAVFIASPEYAPHVAVLAGRRILRAPSLVVTSDDALRLRAERMALSGRSPADLLERYGITHVFAAPGDFRARGIRRPEELEQRGGLKLRYADPAGFMVYEIVP